ncbi:MAG: hypothetical protein Q9204_000805 [Flavoplaca sp. TL-2023a]
MPVAHIGLTVSHLPTSCSFFLAALAPLGYRYFGQSGNQIGFGIDDADFFISQESGNIKATSAHIAFLAPSRIVVDDFFIAALKAGGRIHGEPTERDSGTRYYSAAILDFDDNSIEVMHRDRKATINPRSEEASRVLSWQQEVAASTVGQNSRSERGSPRITVSNTTKPTIMVADHTRLAKAGSDQNSRTLIGTLLGAAAGAAVAYAMSKGDEGRNQTSGNITYQTVEAARSQLAPSAVNTRMSQLPTRIPSDFQPETVMTECSRSRPSTASHAASSEPPFSLHQAAKRLTITAPPAPAAQASTLIDTLAPPSEVPRYRHHPIYRSKTDRAVPTSSSSRRSDHILSGTNPSSSRSSTKTKTQAEPVPSRHSSIVTEFRQETHGSLPPLPASKASSVYSQLEPDSRRGVRDEARGAGDSGTVVESVAPSDSISQAGSKRSKGSRRASQQSSGIKQGGEKEGSQVSDKTIRAEKSKAGSRRPSIVSLPAKPSSRTSVHRSVVSFLPGV